MRLDDWDNQGLKELQEQVFDALESRKEVDSKTQQTRDNQRKRENDFLEELAYLRSSTLKKYMRKISIAWKLEWIFIKRLLKKLKTT